MRQAAQVAAMMVRIFMGFPDLPIGWSSFFILSSRPCRPADYGHRTGVSRDEVDVGPRLDNEHRERGENGGDRRDSHRHVSSVTFFLMDERTERPKLAESSARMPAELARTRSQKQESIRPRYTLVRDRRSGSPCGSPRRGCIRRLSNRLLRSILTDERG